MNTVNFLLGSGIHSGDLPNVSEITNSIIDFEISDYHPEYTKKEKNIKKFINLVFCKILNYYNGYKTVSTYEDLIFIIDQLIDDAWGKKYNPAIADFRKNVFREYGCSENDLNTSKGFDKMLYHLESVREKVDEIIQNKLKRNSVSSKLNLLIEIFDSNDIGLINLFTLNHDKEFEKIFDKNKMSYIDGFEKKDVNLVYYKAYKFDLGLFRDTNEKNIKLFKLHGSIDWHYYGNSPEGYVYKMKDIDITERKPRMIIGTYNKLEQYQSKPFYELFEYFNDELNNELNESNNLIISGYGFQDRWINLFIERWIISKKENKLILIHPNTNELLNKNLRETFIHNKYNKWHSIGKLLTINKRFEDVNWKEIKISMCNGIK